MRLEYYTPLKKSFILQSKGAYFEKICRRATRGTSWPLHFKFASYAYEEPTLNATLCIISTKILSAMAPTNYVPCIGS